MQSVFKTELSDSEVQDIKKFCSCADYFAIEQAIGFSGILYCTRVTYFYLLDGETIKSFCQINENLKFAHIWFGPVCNDRELIVVSIHEILTHYKNRGFWYLGVQMYLKSGFDCDLVEYQLNKTNHIKYIFNSENTKSSLELDLKNSIEDLFRNMRKGHISAIRKAIGQGVVVQEALDRKSVMDFTDIYRRMCTNRSIVGHSANETEQIVNYLTENNMGKLLIARDSGGKVIGGAIFAFQGISVRYLISASDPDRRDLPITHLIIYRALEMSKAARFRYFDFWGYNHFTEKDDQIFNVNSFKKGFGGYFTFFAKKMNINLISGGYNIYKLFGVMKRIKRRLKPAAWT